jgi:hypothetical protein
MWPFRFGCRVWVPAWSPAVKPWRTPVIAVVHPTLFKVMLRFSANSGRIFAENPVMTLQPDDATSMITDVADRGRLRPILLPAHHRNPVPPATTARNRRRGPGGDAAHGARQGDHCRFPVRCDSPQANRAASAEGRAVRRRTRLHPRAASRPPHPLLIVEDAESPRLRIIHDHRMPARARCRRDG